MARTDTGTALTERHRLAQIALRARMLADFVRLWAIWEDDGIDPLEQLAQATVPLVQMGYGMSRALAAAYLRAFRFAELGEPDGADPVTLAVDLAPDEVLGVLVEAGFEQYRRSTQAGHRPAVAKRNALVALSGTVTEQVLTGGRETVIETVRADDSARGWARIVGPNCCAFCAMLATRGPAYKSRATAGFQAHPHCTCGAEPAYDGWDWPAQSLAYKDLYNQAITEAHADGSHDRGTSNDSLNAFRRLLNRQ